VGKFTTLAEFVASKIEPNALPVFMIVG